MVAPCEAEGTVPRVIAGGAPMKLDMDLVREILLAIEAKDDLYPRVVLIPGHDEVVVSRHMDLLYKAGMIDGGVFRPISGLVEVHAVDLSWDGHQMLASIRDPEIWRKTKSIVSQAGQVTIAAIFRAATDIGMAVLKEKFGI